MRYITLYKWTLELHIKGKSDILTPIRIKHVRKTCNYFKDFFPTLFMSTSFTYEDIDIIVDNVKDIYATVSLHEQLYEKLDEEANVETDNYSEENLVFKERFLPVFPDDILPTELRKDSLSKTREEESIEGESVDESTQRINSIVIKLYSIKSLEMNKALYNTIIDDSDVGTALRYIINNSQIEKAIVDPPDNDESYKNLILLPYNFRNSIHSLQTYYGVYITGILVFCDFDIIYILKRFSIDHEYEEGDFSTNKLIVHDGTRADIIPITMVERISDDVLQYEATIVPKKYTSDVFDGEKIGDGLMYTNFGLGYSSLKYKDGNVDSYNPPSAKINKRISSHSMTGEKLRIDYDELNNPYNTQTYMSTMDELAERYILSMTNVNMRSFTPNKLFTVESPNNLPLQEQMKGTFRLNACELEFLVGDQYSELGMSCTAKFVISKKID